MVSLSISQPGQGAEKSKQRLILFPHGWIRLLVVLAAFFVALVGLAKDSTHTRPGAAGESGATNSVRDGSPGTEANRPETRLREGSRIVNEEGEFADTGNRIIFEPSGNGGSFQTLENLALERISGVLDENSVSRQWVVTGTVTEFRGSNFLLVTRAVLKTKRAPERRAGALAD